MRRSRVRLHSAAADLRVHLARADTLVALSLLAIVVGLLTGGVIVSFRLITEYALVWVGLLPGIERYEALDPAWRFGLPVAGGLLVGLLLQFVPPGVRAIGVAHVMTILVQRGGRLPWPNAVVQFIGGAASIVAGHSVGREGPVIHVGAASASLLGQWLRLPNNSIRTLVACGVAASVAASFNTPLAGVILAMEVVMLEYSLIGFAPVILAAVGATALGRLAFGADAPLLVPRLQLASLLELPWIVLLGAVIGVLSAAYVFGITSLDRMTRRVPVWLRTTIAGLFVGLCAQRVPEVMGLGYDTVQLAMAGGLALAALATIAAVKLAATVVCGGLAVPGGMIGPMLVIGACAGGALGDIGHDWVPGASAAPAFYATIGAVAMMGACLHAPLAALVAVLELTANPNLILPGLAAVMTAFLVARAGFGQPPLFVGILRGRGVDYRVDPVALALARAGVAASMTPAPRIVDLAQIASEQAPEGLAPGQVALERAAPERAAPEQAAPEQAPPAAGPAARLPDPPGTGPVVIVRGADVIGAWSPQAWSALIASGESPTAEAIGRRSPPVALVSPEATLAETLAGLDAARADIAVIVDAVAAADPIARAGASLGRPGPPARRRLRGTIERARIVAEIRGASPEGSVVGMTAQG
ncbi:MAG: chloride channel protein [Lautropia sp.]